MQHTTYTAYNGYVYYKKLNEVENRT